MEFANLCKKLDEVSREEGSVSVGSSESRAGSKKSQKMQILCRKVSKKVLRPSFTEVRDNPRARSARMRVIERIR